MFASRFTLITISIIVGMFLFGCSGNPSPISPDNPNNTISQTEPIVGVTDTFTDGSPAAGMGVMGLFELKLDPIAVKAELSSIRSSALTDVLEVVDITNFLTLAPCSNCVKIKSVAMDNDGNLVVTIGIKHPFDVGDPYKPITGRNRGDLHVFNVEGIIVSDATGASFSPLGATIANTGIVNADGYTGYLDARLDTIFPTNASVHPYILHFDDYSAGNFSPLNSMGFESVTTPPPSGNLVMAMGCDYDYQEYVFSPMASEFNFIYAVGCSYAVSSASKSTRFTPEYRVPQHNKKAASEVKVNITENNLASGDTSSTASMEISIVDISHGVAVGDALNEMRADSSVDDIFIFVPGVTNSPVVLDGNSPVSGTGRDPSNPLIYSGTITNTAGAGLGTYFGLVKVTDTYAPGQNTSPLLNAMDGIEKVDPLANPLTGLFQISEFATYQAFTLDVGQEVQIVVQSPNGGETLYMGMFHDISWEIGSGAIANVKIEWSTDDFVSDIRTIIDSTPNDGSYMWEPIPVEDVTTGKIKISDVAGPGYDTSDNNFSIILPVWLDFQTEMIVDAGTATWGGFETYCHAPDEISPAISQDTDGMVHVMHYAVNTSSCVHIYSFDRQVRSQNGTTWQGSAGFFNSSTDFGRDDLCKVAPSHNGLTWGCVNLSWNLCGWYSDVDRDLGGPGYYCFSGTPVRFNATPHRYPEIASDQAGYVFMFGDNNVANQISWNKTNQPGFNAYGSSAQVTSVQQLTNDGIISKTRSWARQGEGVALIYFTQGGNIMLAETTDAPTNNTWDTTETVWTGTGYSNVNTPALCADSQGRLYAVWTGMDTATSQYRILSSRRDTVNGAWSTPVIVTSSTTNFEDVHISCKPIAMPTGTTEDVAVVSWENADVVSSALSPYKLLAFLPETTVSASGAVCKSPDGMCLSTSFGYQYDVIFAWSWQDGNWDIVLRNANLKTP